MGKRGYNWKSRQVVETVIDNSPTKKIKLDLSVEGNYDQSNEFALPAKKRSTKVKTEEKKNVKILSQKQRKRLENIVKKKEKKSMRSELFEKLSKVQATPEELNQLTSIASVQTKGLKKLFNEEKIQKEIELLPNLPKINTLKGAKRKLLINNRLKYDKNDPNIVGLESSSEDENDSDDDDDKEVVESLGINNLIEKEQNEETSGKINETVKIEDDEEETSNKSPTQAAEKIKTKNNEEKKEIRKPAVFVEVERTDEIQKARLKLPILAEEQQIMEVINENDIIIIAGETGSGKTTQVPQFLYEAGYALNDKMIAVTEPRRVAAISMSRRVADEMYLTTDEVSYLIRFAGNVTDRTRIKFMTDGVLLQEFKSDCHLTKYSAIILDEAHERSVNTDVLIGFLSRIVAARKKRGDPLKLIVMSATLRVQDFTENPKLFKKVPPVVNVEARQFPVTVHFNRITQENYVNEALRKTVKIHNTLPDGGILVFVTGQKEVNYLVKKLRRMFPLKTSKIVKVSDEVKNEESSDEEFEERLKRCVKKSKRAKMVPQVNLDDYDIPGDDGIESGNDDDDENFESDGETEPVEVATSQPLWVLPLYSLLPNRKQAQVFEKPPDGCRLCVVSTNVAETSVTIPNVKYVVDTGKTKTKLYDKVTGVTSYAVTWTSKASANQRAGRAGRTGPGHCYRLYSSAVYNDVFVEFSEPEILKRPVDSLFLQLKCMHVHKVHNFPFPTAPNLLQLKMSERRLEVLGLIERARPTALGRAVARLPILPRFGKMLLLSHQFGLLPYTICLVAALSVQEVLLETPIDPAGDSGEIRDRWLAIRRKWARDGNYLLLGDAMVLLTAIGGAEFAHADGKLERFCQANGLRHKAVAEIRKLRVQLTNEMNSSAPGADVSVDPKLPPPSDVQAKLLRQIILCGLGDQIAKRVDPSEFSPSERKKLKYAYHTNDLEQPVFVNRGSVLSKELPEFVVYQEIYETNKIYMRGVTAVEPEWLPVYVPELCNLSEPLPDPGPSYDADSGRVKCRVNGTFGKRAFAFDRVEIDYPDNAEVYKWFCRFLLEGKVFAKLARYAKDLIYPAHVVVKPWAKLQPRVVKVLHALAARKVKCRRELEDVWEEEPKYLLNEYLMWVPETVHSEVSLMWPPHQISPR